MKKLFTSILALLLVSSFALLAIHSVNAEITGMTWLTPAWRNRSDPVLGHVDVGYISGQPWMMNMMVRNLEQNSSVGPSEPVNITVTNIAVWFDWNRFYNNTENQFILYGTSNLFTVNSTTEDTSIASNLFTHSYKIYVDFQFMNGTSAVTRTMTFTPDGNFAVLSQTQYNADASATAYSNFRGLVSSYVNDFASSQSLYVQSELEYGQAQTSYANADFSGALQHYTTASNLLNQSWIAYGNIETKYDNADLDMRQAQINSINANATGISNALMVNSVAFLFFGLGFIVFGIAAIVWARRPKPAQ